MNTLRWKVGIPHFLFEAKDEEDVTAGKHSNSKKEQEHSSEKKLQHIMVDALYKEVTDSNLGVVNSLNTLFRGLLLLVNGLLLSIFV